MPQMSGSFSGTAKSQASLAIDDERRGRAGALGAAEFLTKPVDFGLLKAQLRQLSNAAD
jgi:hypothetical protein